MRKWKKFLSIMLTAAMVLGGQSIATVNTMAENSDDTPQQNTNESPWYQSLIGEATTDYNSTTDTFTLTTGVSTTSKFTIPKGATLEIATNGDYSSFAGLDIKGKLINHGKLNIGNVSSESALTIANDSTIENEGDIIFSGVWSSGSYSGVASGKAITDLINKGVGGNYTLFADATLTVSPEPTTDLTMNLNNKTLTLGTITANDSTNGSIVVADGKSLKLENGNLNAKQANNGSTSIFIIHKGASIELNGITADTNGTLLSPRGGNANVTVKNSTVNCGVFAVGTNAGQSTNYPVTINLTDSHFSSKYGYNDNDNDSCPIMINVPGTLNMTRCTVQGTRQGVLVRGGTATIKDSNIALNPLYTGSTADRYWSKNWGTGDEVPMAALVVGNRNDSYPYPASCTIENTEVYSLNDEYKAAYIYAMNNDSSSSDRSASLSISGNSDVHGAILRDNGNPATIVITGGKFSTDPAVYVPDGYSTAANADGTWTVAPVGEENAAVKIGSTYYKTLNKAVDAAQDGDTVTVLRNCNFDEVQLTKNLTLNLNGKTISRPIETWQNNSWKAFQVTEGATLTIDGEVTGSSIHGTLYAGKSSNNNGNLVIKGGTYSSVPGTAVIQSNGSCDNTSIKAENAIFNGDDVAFYQAGGGNYSLTNCTINGTTGIYMKAGTLAITGSTIKATGAYVSPESNGNGASSTGDGIILDAKSGYNGNMNLSLDAGCKVSSANGYAIDETYTDSATTATHSITITGGYYASGKESIHVSDFFKQAVLAGTSSISVTSGYYTSDPSALLKTGYKALNANWQVDDHSYAYKVIEKPINKIESVSAQAYADENKDMTNPVTASLSNLTITVTGKIPDADDKISINYILTDGTTGQKDVVKGQNGYDSSVSFDITETVGTRTYTTRYTIDLSGLTSMPEKVATAAPTIDNAAAETVKTGGDQSIATAAAAAINTAKTSLKAEGLSAAAANTVKTTGTGAETITVVPVGNASGKENQPVSNVIETAKKAEGAPSSIIAPKAELVVIVQPIIDIKITNATNDSTSGIKTVTFDVSAFTQAIVTTKTVANTLATSDPTTLFTSGNNANAVNVGTPAKMTVDNDITITIPVSKGFVTNDNKDKIYFRHQKHNGVFENVKGTANENLSTETFTVHGLSEIVMTADGRKGTVIYYKDTDKTIELITQQYTPADVNQTELPTTSAPSGKHQTGWSINNVQYIGLGTLTDTMLNAIDNIETKAVTAIPIFASDSSPVAPVGPSVTTYSVSFDSNGGTGTMSSLSATSGSSVTLTKNSFTYEGYKFTGWNTSKDGKGTAYADGAKIASVTANITLYAQWEKEAAPAAVTPTEYSGTDRYDTMSMLVKAGNFDKGGVVVIATGEGYADALAASGLAGLSNAPIILTDKAGLNDKAKSLLTDLAPKTIYIMGGEGALTMDTEDAIKTAVPAASVTRENGTDRFNTALKAYAQGKDWSKQAIIVDGQNYADALSIAPYAYAAKCPIFLSDEKTGLDADTVAALKAGGFTSAVITGGTGAVPAAVQDQLKDNGITAVERFAGQDRYDTCQQIAKWAVGSSDSVVQPLVKLTYAAPAVATGTGYADALAGAAFCGRNQSVMLLANEGTVGLTCINGVLKADKADVKSVSILGGTGAVSDTVREAVKDALK